MSEVCSDCKGKGTYQGFNTKTEPCSRCHGTGKLKVTKDDALRDDNDVYEAGNKTEVFYIPHNDVVFNMTQNRWECIKSGTPTWH